MRLLGVSALALAAMAAACGSDDGSAASSAPTGRLTIRVWPQGESKGGARSWTLECGPAGGSHPHPARACARLAAVPNAFKPVPRDQMCTQIYGGPEEALVTGTYRGARVNARFNRVNGCEIARWDRVAVLFPIAAGAGA
jgi:subtilisin inhibitor-like